MLEMRSVVYPEKVLLVGSSRYVPEGISEKEIIHETVTLLRNYSLFLITSKYSFDKLCLYSITMHFLLMIFLTDDGHCSRGLGSDKSVDERVVVFPSTRVTVYDPLARGGIKSKDRLRHG